MTCDLLRSFGRQKEESERRERENGREEGRGRCKGELKGLGSDNREDRIRDPERKVQNERKSE
jgi:hypothetical protein